VKKLIPLFFAVSFIYSSCGYYLLQLFFLNHCNSVTAFSHKSESLEAFWLCTGEFEKSGESEIMLQGKMYDIIKSVRKGDRTLIYAVHDEAEDDIIANLNMHIERIFETSSNHSPDPVKQVLKFNVYDFLSINILRLNAPFINTIPHSVQEFSMIESEFIASLSPPPWLS
jgi:hypothetical protein